MRRTKANHGESRPKHRSIKRRLVRWFALMCFLIVVALPLTILLLLKWLPPPTSSFMIQHRLEQPKPPAKKTPVRHHWTDWREISAPMKLAAVAAEDQKFPRHWGFDADAISDAWARRERGESVRGASTITQQVAKNLFLWSEKSFIRKGLEAYLTAATELLWSKRRILEVYLNIAEFGDGVFGVGAASEQFFKEKPANLTQEEAALLAAVLPNPRRFRVERPSAYVAERQAWIVSQMNVLGSGYLTSLK